MFLSNSNNNGENNDLVAQPVQFRERKAMFQRNGDDNQRNQQFQSSIPRHIKDVIDTREGNNEKEYMIPLKVLRLEEIGTVKMTKQTTFSKLRQEVSKKINSSSFVFQDVSTKRPIANESRKVLASTSNVIMADKSADVMLGDGTIHGNSSFGAKDGSFAFKVCLNSKR